MFSSCHSPFLYSSHSSYWNFLGFYYYCDHDDDDNDDYFVVVLLLSKEESESFKRRLVLFFLSSFMKHSTSQSSSLFSSTPACYSQVYMYMYYATCTYHYHHVMMSKNTNKVVYSCKKCFRLEKDWNNKEKNLIFNIYFQSILLYWIIFCIACTCHKRRYT